MAVYDQQITSYSDTTPHKRAIGDMIHMIDPEDVPFLARIGIDSARTKFNVGVRGTKIEILEDELDPLSTTANQGTTITTTTLSITVSDGSVFQDGHVIKIDAEYMVVTGVSSEVITVQARDYGGTNAEHATGVAISIVGMARDEGDDADYGPIVDITAPYNYTGIYQKGLNISGTMQAIEQYGIDDEMAYQAEKAMPHLLRLVNLMAYHGVRDAGSGSTRRSAGGLETFITDNTIGAGGTITKTDVDGLAEKIYMDGGQPNALFMNPAVANDIRNILDSSSFIRVDQVNTVFGMKAITTLRTQYFDLELVMDRHCPVAKAYMLDTRKVGYYLLRQFARHELAVTGDSDKNEVVGELSLLVANDKSHGIIETITS